MAENSDHPDARAREESPERRYGRRSWGPEEDSDLELNDASDEGGDDSETPGHRAARAAAEDVDNVNEVTEADDTDRGDSQPEASQSGADQSTAGGGPNQGRNTADPAARPSGSNTPQTSPGVRSPQPSATPPGNLPAGDGSRYSAGDLIAQLTPVAQQRARTGWRAKLGLGPTQREQDEDRDTQIAKTAFTQPVTIMVANPKGGVGKTPTSLLLAAAFGLARGGGVVAWDNNELRGTMPDRSESPHRRNVRDVLDAMELLGRSDAQFTELAHFLNHQASGNFYTLGSAQTADRVVSDIDFELVHTVFGRFFQVIVVDTGNNEAAPNWAATAATADCLVVPTKWRSDSLIPAARMLETLQDSHPDLLRRTVIVATNGPADVQSKVKANGASWFGSAHPIVELPTDPHIAEGGVINYAKLKPGTRRAALHLAAEVTRRLADSDLD